MNKLFTALLLCLMFAAKAAFACADGGAAPDSSRDLSIGPAVFTVADDDERRTVTTLGTIKNASPACFENVVVEIKYFDAGKTLVDSTTELVYGLVVPGNNEVAFKVSDSAAKAKQAYVSQTVRVVSADPRRSRAPVNKSTVDVATEYLLSWAPMLLLIGVWIFFMRRMKAKDSPQVQSLALIVEQNALFAAQNQLLERLVAAAEAKR